MPLVTTKEMLLAAKERHFAVGAFNANNMEQIQGIIDAAVEERAPVILQVSQGAIRYAGLNFAAAMVKTAAEEADVPVALHLDHGSDFAQNVRCLRAGFTSLMYDGSKEPYEDNVAMTRRVVEIADVIGVPVEAELGCVLQSRDNVTPEEVEAAMTNPDQAAAFVEATGCSSLAVAVGSIHGMKESKAEIDIDRLDALCEAVDIPFVLHGASGVKEESAQEAIQHGICKINVATRLNQAFVRGIAQGQEELPNNVDPRKWLSYSRDNVKEVVRHKIRLFGANNQVTSAGFVSPSKSYRSTELGHAE